MNKIFSRQTLSPALALLAALIILAPATPVWAANEWGIPGEEKVRFDAKVVDILCEITGDCPDDCGGGKRQLGLLKDDGTLLLVPKNSDPFAGASVDMKPYCGQVITADGLYIKTEHMPVFALQFLRVPPDGEWVGAKGFTRKWSKENVGKKANQWFRNDQRIKDQVETNGVLGIPGLVPEE